MLGRQYPAKHRVKVYGINGAHDPQLPSLLGEYLKAFGCGTNPWESIVKIGQANCFKKA